MTSGTAYREVEGAPITSGRPAIGTAQSDPADSLRRVARALASVEAKQQAAWEEEFFAIRLPDAPDRPPRSSGPAALSRYAAGNRFQPTPVLDHQSVASGHGNHTHFTQLPKSAAHRFWRCRKVGSDIDLWERKEQGSIFFGQAIDHRNQEGRDLDL